MSLKLEQVHKSFPSIPKPIEVLRGLDLDVQKGEVVAIIGSSGSGKSTLLSVLSGMDTPDRGKIQVGKTDLGTLTSDEKTKFRGRCIGIVFQQFHLIPTLTAIENITLPLELRGQDSPIDEAKRLLEEVGLADRADHYPNQLSGGECQRVAIARSLIIRPEILLADEPTGNLDNSTNSQVSEILFQSIRTHGTTSLIVTHNLELAKKCDRIFELSNGVLSRK